MFKVTRYCVKPANGETALFYTRGEALGVAGRMLKRARAVRVYEVTGWPVQDLWDRPRLVARLSLPSRCA